MDNIKNLINLFLKSGGKGGLGQNAKITFKEKSSKKNKKEVVVSAKIKTKEKIATAEKIEQPIISPTAIEAPQNTTKQCAQTSPNIKKESIHQKGTEMSRKHKDEFDSGKKHTERIIYENDSIYEQTDLIYTINKDELSSLCKSGEKMITVGLDFGTHQTKICIESKGGVELNYTFMKFGGYGNKMYYAFPSIIGVGRDKKMRYGFLPKNYDGEIIRYFKQTAFKAASPNKGMTQEQAFYYSIWYLSYILFDLEEIYGQNFIIQMGAPTDSGHIRIAKQIATRIIASSYKLVEEVFENDKKKFLDTNIDTLKSLTELVTYSDEIKEDYGLLVFPEAYACLKPLTSQKKIATGMNLMIDIGGGTTDISFYTIENDSPQVYDFFSINKGLNYLICAEERDNKIVNSNVKDESEINRERRTIFTQEVKNICFNIQKKLENEFRIQTSLYKSRLLDALKNRPLVYCGGGSTFSSLRIGYAGFVDKKQISEKEWNIKAMSQYNEIKSKELFPILSTSYGLAISAENDNIKTKPFRDIFEGIRGAMEDYMESGYDRFNYADDYDALK